MRKFPKLYVKESADSYVPASSIDVFAAARIMAEKFFEKKPKLTTPSDTRQYLKARVVGLEHEIFGIVFLNNRNGVIACEHLFRGTIDGCSVHPREVVKAALNHNAAAIILFHNHPSGTAEPSQADQIITRRLRDALNLIDVRILDHFVIGANSHVSFAERGLI